MFAVIKTGGKQYQVKEGQILKVEKLPGKEKTKVDFDQVLLVNDKIGQPILKDAKVIATITKQGRYPKALTVKFKSKKRYQRTYGFRQSYTEVKIDKITI